VAGQALIELRAQCLRSGDRVNQDIGGRFLVTRSYL
jgi:hypothetical protein